ncbi:MAG: hypothetical protein M3R51_04105 [Candidatus Eremiobacteraeota bacterium]|nr:hypothetical protein [Candidatus Eremiobacteraeota bacterium]
MAKHVLITGFGPHGDERIMTQTASHGLDDESSAMRIFCGAKELQS